MLSTRLHARKSWHFLRLLLLLSLFVTAAPARRDVLADESELPPEDPARTIALHLAIGKARLKLGQPAAAQEGFKAALKLDATQRDALQLMTEAQRQLEAQETRSARTRERLQRASQELAGQWAREKTKTQAREVSEARKQVANSRERQLKLMYQRGVSLYYRGRLQEAIEALQQMVALDPDHKLVAEARRVIARAEAKQAEQRAHARAPRTPAGPGTVTALEGQLAAKRIEIDAAFKQAQRAHKDRQYDLATDLTQRVLIQDPLHDGAQKLLHAVELAKLQDEERRLSQRVERDERAMINDVIQAQRVPEMREITLKAPAVAGLGDAPGIAPRLRQPITFDFAEVPLGDVIDFLADAAGVSFVPSPQLDLKARKVSLKVTELPLDQALKYLAKQQDLSYRVSTDAIVLATAEEFSNEPLETRVFFMKNGLSPFALQTAAIQSNPALVMEGVKDLIARSIPQPPGSKVVVDERSGAIVVTNTAEHLGMIESLLGQLDVAPVQVLIEARFIELNMTDLEHLGLETILNSDTALDKKGAGDGTRGTGQQLASGGGIKFPALSRESEGLNLTLQGVLTGTQFEAVLHLLDETSKSKTLSAPRVTALNNQSARIRVVEEFNYPTRYEVALIQFDINGDGDFDDAGETEFANVPQDLQTRDVGILLNVTPSVGRDRRSITLVLAPEVSEFSQFRDLGGGVTVPEFTTSQLTTSIVIEDGQTVVLGGLMQDTTTDEVDKVPFFGDLPWVGPMFRQTSKSATRSNLLIFVTARLLSPGGQTI